MKISAISNNGYSKRSNFKNNKISNSTNSIAGENLITPSLNQLQAYSKISFKGAEEFFDFLKKAEDPIQFKNNFSYKTPIENIQKAFSSEPDKLEAFLLKKRDFPILCLANSEQIKAFAEILGDRAHEVIAKALTLTDKFENTALHYADTDKIKAIKDALGDEAPETIAKIIAIKNKLGNTTLHSTSASGITGIKDALGNHASKVIASIMTVTNKRNETPLHNASADKVIMIKNALADNSSKVIGNIIATQNIYGETALHGADTDKIKAIARALDTKAPTVMADIIMLQNKHGNTVLHLANADEIREYRKIFKKNTKNVFKKALLIKNNKNQLAIYPYPYCINNIDKLEALAEVAPNATLCALAQKYNGKTYLELWREELK